MSDVHDCGRMAGCPECPRGDGETTMPMTGEGTTPARYLRGNLPTECETPDYTEGPCHCAFHDPENARRERYAAAIFDASAASAGESAYADAAMAVADEEIEDVDGKLQRAAEHAVSLLNENARLRAEQREYDERFDAQNAELTRLRAEVSAANMLREEKRILSERLGETRDTIERGRTVLDEWYGTSDASALSAALREALDGDNRCGGCGGPRSDGVHGPNQGYGGCV
ncbi:hypothetical protein OG436_29500 [Streptomyces caniferus]|uniref:hypothetical protein n=1 Tax=Streptomyces caniferus TaxID=285557 RepID=UPI002E29649D|nr:hypothetical protein [Streptomyces caniferus]